MNARDFRVGNTITEVAEHLFTVNTEILFTMDGDEYRFVRVGTRTFWNRDEADQARIYQKDMTESKIGDGWISKVSLMAGHDDSWKNVPNRAVISERMDALFIEKAKPLVEKELAEVVEATDPFSRVFNEEGVIPMKKPFDRMVAKARQAQALIGNTRREEGKLVCDGVTITFRTKSNSMIMTRATDVEGGDRTIPANVGWEMLTKGAKLNVFGSNPTLVVKYITQYGGLTLTPEEQEALFKLNANN